MNYIRYDAKNDVRWGRLEGDAVHALSAAPYLNGEETGETLPFSEVRLRAAGEPSKIVAVGMNYYDHAMEFCGSVPKVPALFIMPTTCVNDPFGEIVYPSISERIDYEGELAVVIGKKASKVKAGEAQGYIFGYTILNDVTARDIQKSDVQWTRGKCIDGFAPIGPWIVTGLDPSDLELTTRVNGEVRQHARTSLFMTKIPELLEFITEGITLLPGDIVATGTPAGISPMNPGDVVEVEIEGIGILQNRLVASK